MGVQDQSSLEHLAVVASFAFALRVASGATSAFVSQGCTDVVGCVAGSSVVKALPYYSRSAFGHRVFSVAAFFTGVRPPLHTVRIGIISMDVICWHAVVGQTVTSFCLVGVT